MSSSNTVKPTLSTTTPAALSPPPPLLDNNVLPDSPTQQTAQKRKLSDDQTTSAAVVTNDSQTSSEMQAETSQKDTQQAESGGDGLGTVDGDDDDSLCATSIPLIQNQQQQLIAATTHQLKKKLCIKKFKEINDARTTCIENLNEQYFISNSQYTYTGLAKWKTLQLSDKDQPNPPTSNSLLYSANSASVNLANPDTIMANIEKCNEFIQNSFPKDDIFNIERKLSNQLSIPQTALQVNDQNQQQQQQQQQISCLLKKSAPKPVTTSVGGGASSSDKQFQSIAERAKHEAQILQRVAQLRKEGLWSIKRLPKLVEPARAKTHWDFLLDEMMWMSTDFQQERRWKKTCSRKLALAIQKHFKDRELKAELAEKEETKRLRKQAQFVGREIMQFWRNVEKLIEYKNRVLSEEKRKQAMDLHLNFIVDQTEKYSNWLMEGLSAANTAATGSTLSHSPVSNVGESTTTTVESAKGNKRPLDTDDNEDEEYDAEKDEDDEDDDEETIEREERLAQLERQKKSQKPGDNEQEQENKMEEVDTDDQEDQEAKEIEMLKKESELSLDDLLSDYNLDEKYFESLRPVVPSTSSGTASSSVATRSSRLLRRQSNKENTVEALDSDDNDNDDDDDDDDDDTISDEDEDEAEELSGDEEAEETKPQEDGDGGEKKEDLSFLITDDQSSAVQQQQTDPDDLSKKAATTTASGLDKDDKVLNSIAATAQSFQPTGYTLETTKVKTQVPSLLLKHTLREYQHVGLDWLVTMYENKLNGILADEMGLGKTIQTIALLAHLAEDKGIWGPHLIIVPTSVMLNWELEFKKWCPGFKILTYYGSPKERRLKRQGWTKVNAFHVCITSYKLVIQDHAAFRRKKWKYFILDEAQNIKNFRSQRWQALLNFQSQRRLLLTGTPLQNNLMELWSLMHFLMPHVFASHREFAHWFSNPLKCMIEGNQEYNEQLIRRLHKVLRPFILRRLKVDVEKQMPKKYEHVVQCQLSKRQRLLYDEFMSLSSTKRTLNEGNYMSVINILMQLRKVCNHPDLFDPRPIVSSFVAESLDFRAPSLVFNLKDKCLLDKLDAALFGQQDSLVDLELLHSAFGCHRAKQLQTPRKLIEEILTTPTAGDLDLVASPSTAVSSVASANQEEVKFFSDSSLEGWSLVDLETRMRRLESPGGGPSAMRAQQKQLERQVLKSQRLKNKIHYLAQTNKQHCNMNARPMYGIDLQECVGSSQIMTPAKDHALTATALNYGARSHVTCTRTYEYEKTRHRMSVYWTQTRALNSMLHLVDDLLFKPSENAALDFAFSRFVLYVPRVTHYPRSTPDPFDRSIRLHVSHPSPSFYQSAKTLVDRLSACVKPLVAGNPARSALADRIGAAMCTQFPEKRLIQYDCGKLQTMAVLLRRLFAESHRVLVFTQMTRMLDILENFLNYHGFKYLRLDGSTSIEQRQVLMERFNSDKRIFCFILSTRSGGIGVNLTGADTVIFYDSDWNPTMDAQAQDRCHRIGQTRDVHIYRLISEKTVEENILKKANQKRLLSEMTIEGGNFTTALLKKHHITELFEQPTGLASLVTVAPHSQTQAAEPSETQQQPSTSTSAAGDMDVVAICTDQPDTQVPQTQQQVSPAVKPQINEAQFEAVLAMVEDETDVQAAKILKAEVKADSAEFDENEPLLGADSDALLGKQHELSKVECELKSLETELKPIERYALKFLESVEGTLVSIKVEEKAPQEIEIEKAKQEWELNRLKQLKEEEERKAEQEEDDMMFTYAKTEVVLTRSSRSSQRGNDSSSKNVVAKAPSKSSSSSTSTLQSSSSSSFSSSTAQKRSLKSSSASSLRTTTSSISLSPSSLNADANATAAATVSPTSTVSTRRKTMMLLSESNKNNLNTSRLSSAEELKRASAGESKLYTVGKYHPKPMMASIKQAKLVKGKLTSSSSSSIKASSSKAKVVKRTVTVAVRPTSSSPKQAEKAKTAAPAAISPPPPPPAKASRSTNRPKSVRFELQQAEQRKNQEQTSIVTRGGAFKPGPEPLELTDLDQQLTVKTKVSPVAQQSNTKQSPTTNNSKQSPTGRKSSPKSVVKADPDSAAAPSTLLIPHSQVAMVAVTKATTQQPSVVKPSRPRNTNTPIRKLLNLAEDDDIFKTISVKAAAGTATGVVKLQATPPPPSQPQAPITLQSGVVVQPCTSATPAINLSALPTINAYSLIPATQQKPQIIQPINTQQQQPTTSTIVRTVIRSNLVHNTAAAGLQVVQQGNAAPKPVITANKTQQLFIPSVSTTATTTQPPTSLANLAIPGGKPASIINHQSPAGARPPVLVTKRLVNPAAIQMLNASPNHTIHFLSSNPSSSSSTSTSLPVSGSVTQAPKVIIRANPPSSMLNLGGNPSAAMLRPFGNITLPITPSTTTNQQQQQPNTEQSGSNNSNTATLAATVARAVAVETSQSLINTFLKQQQEQQQQQQQSRVTNIINNSIITNNTNNITIISSPSKSSAQHPNIVIAAAQTKQQTFHHEQQQS